jgi:DNA topoisomerase-1
MARRKKLSILNSDPVDSAKEAGLRYVTDAEPGIRRQRRGRGFRYVDKDGKPVRDKETLARIRSLVIPPAWQNVWICAKPKGHLQVTGRDARGRKQSRYHPRWRSVRDETKYERMTIFGELLPVIRERVDHDLSLPGLPRLKILAVIVRLMEVTLIRVGNEEYARENQSYGLTTMRNKHVQVEGSGVTFKFPGKSRVKHIIDFNDRRLAKIIERCQDIPGYELFQYVHEDFTAKDFRTWAGTVLACSMLQEFEAFGSQTEAKRNVVQAIKDVAARLGNTPSVCRKCYVHPAVLDSYLSGAMIKTVKVRVEQEGENSPYALRQEETALLQLLKKRISLAAA